MVVNKAISFVKKLDPEVFTPLSLHAGKIIKLHIFLPFASSKTLFLEIKNNDIVFTHSAPAAALVDLTLSGKLSDFCRFGLNYQQSNALQRNNIQCIGDTHLLQAWQTVLQHLDLDWTVIWAPVVGHKMAFSCTQLFKKGKDYISATKQSTAYSIKEYILYEKNAFVLNAEMEQWIESVMTLRNDTERLEKNITWLKARIEKLT